MKLILCMTCKDIYSLNMEMKRCRCGETRGRYTDNQNAWFSGNAIPLGISNPSFIEAIGNQPDHSPGKRFEAFVIERDCATFKEREHD